jgi:hypothetical protein
MSTYYIDDGDAGELLRRVDPWPDGWTLFQVDSTQWKVQTDDTNPTDENLVRDLSVPLRERHPDYFEWK